MNYQEAFSKALTCYGQIKCTYAEIYNKSGKKLFSAQSTDFHGFHFAANAVRLNAANGLVPIRNSREFAMIIERKLLKNKRLAGDHAELFQTIENGGVLYVKACALDWQPSKDPEEISEETATDETIATEATINKKQRKIRTGLLLALAGALISN